MKTLILLCFFLSSFSLFAQTIAVKSDVVDLGIVYETLGDSTKRVVLKLNADSPKEFKVKFLYKYKFTSKQLGDLYVAPSGDLGVSFRETSEYFENDNKVQIDVSESTLNRGDDLELILEISKPNKNVHGVKVTLNLKESKGNVVSGGKRLLGLIGRSYTVKAECD